MLCRKFLFTSLWLCPQRITYVERTAKSFCPKCTNISCFTQAWALSKIHNRIKRVPFVMEFLHQAFPHEFKWVYTMASWAVTAKAFAKIAQSWVTNTGGNSNLSTIFDVEFCPKFNSQIGIKLIAICMRAVKLLVQCTSASNALLGVVSLAMHLMARPSLSSL